jgi:hypothetical protein
MTIHLPTRELSEGVLATLKSLKAGDRIKLVQTVRVGGKTWPAETVGVYRGINYLSTGVTTERVKEDDIVLPTVHFTKDNGELASICLDERTAITKL